jgi:uncharacterized protein YhdP
MTGNLSLGAKNVAISNISGTDLRINGVLKDRNLDVSQLTMNTLGGHAAIEGSIRLSKPVPTITLGGKVSELTGGLFLKSMGAKTAAIDGEGIIVGRLSARGEHGSDYLASLEGDVSVYSRNGVIRKWNLLSKLFGLLNVYDLFRGKVPLTETGLTYKKMGAVFQVKNGILSTKNFLIDSPSMLITGEGDISARNHEVNGRITVSPLVTLDTTIERIPIVRNLLRERDKGFLYAAYNVKGPLDDPDLSVSFVQTIGGKTIELLKNLLTLPIELFEQRKPNGKREPVNEESGP